MIKKGAFMLLGLGLCTFPLWAQDLKEQSVTVFKNGQTFYAESHEIKTDDKARVYLKKLPQFRFGTFLAKAQPEIYGIKSINVEERKKANFSSYRQMLNAYSGKKVKITIKAFNELQNIEAKVIGVSGEFVSIQPNNAPLQMLKIKDIQQLTALEAGPLDREYKTESRQLELQLKNSSDKAKLDFSFMVNGTGWAPQYELVLIDDKTAKLSLKALLINDVRDIENAKVNFVVGVPNFKFAENNVSPLVSNESFWNFMSSLGGSVEKMDEIQPLMNQMATQRRTRAAYAEMAYDDYEEDEAYYAPPPSEVSGSTEEDFYVYSTDKISLEKGGRGLFKLFESRIPYKHVYEAKLRPNGGWYSPQKDKADVWHSLELENNTENTWTTGAATAWPEEGKENKLPLSQEVLEYTPPKGKTTLRLTQSPDIDVVAQEEEISRETGKKIRRQVYDILEIKGRITVRNLKNKEITLDLKRRITGVLKSCSMNWEKEKCPGHTGENHLHDVQWQVDLKVGEEKEITYRYTLYRAR